MSFAVVNGNNKSLKTTKEPVKSDAKLSTNLDNKNPTELTHPLIYLQKAIGNQAVQRLMTSNASFDFAKIGIQSKLKVSRPDDDYEQEADRIAEDIMRMSVSSNLASPMATTKGEEGIDRKCSACEMKEEEEKVKISRKLASSNGTNSSEVSENITGSIDSLRNHGGSPLDRSTREFMESRFDYDFSDVRIHTGALAARAAETIQAKAFTIGHHITFGAGEYAPESYDGRRLIAHELAHVNQQTARYALTDTKERPTPNMNWTAQDSQEIGRSVMKHTISANSYNANFSMCSPHASLLSHNVVARQVSPENPTVAAPAEVPSTQSPVDDQSINGAADIIIDALEGYTSGSDSARILEQFRGRSPATVRAIITELKNRKGESIVDWLLEDMTEEDGQALVLILIMSRVDDMIRLVVEQIKDALEGYTSEDDSIKIVQLISMFYGTSLDTVLIQLEAAMQENEKGMADWLFGDVDRSNAERIRQYFLSANGGPRAMDYAATWTASKIYSLLSGYTSHSDSSDILWNFRTVPTSEARALVYVRLDALTQAKWEQSAEAALMEDIDQSDYEALRGLEGLSLGPYVYEQSWFEKLISGAEWGLIVAEWIVCGLIGVITGVLSVVWDLVKLVWDVLVAAKDLLWSLVYLISGGAAGSENWLAVKKFFIGLGQLFTEPGKVFDHLWAEVSLEFHTIEGALADCRRAEFIVRKFVNGIVTIILIFLAGYGIVKGGAAGLQAAARFAELAEIFGVRGAIHITVRLAGKGITRFVTVTAEQAKGLFSALSRPTLALRQVGRNLNVIFLSAKDEGYWHYIRRNAGIAKEALIENERKFWEEQRRYWNERANLQNDRYTELDDTVNTLNQKLEQNRAPEDANEIIKTVDEQTEKLGEGTNQIYQEVTGRSSEGPVEQQPKVVATREPTPIPTEMPPMGFPPSTPESETAARTVLSALRDSGIPEPPRGAAIGVFYHQNGSVSIGPSGSAERASAVRAALEGRIPRDWVIGPIEMTPEMVHPAGLRPWQPPGGQIRPGRATCSECRLSCAGRTNPSPVEGMTVLQWGGEEPTRFTGPSGIMRPCESCQANVDRIMEPIKVVPRTPPATE